jgi:fatty acid desaturase
MADDPNRPERPRAEPEIIPPDRFGTRSDGRRSPWATGWGPYGMGQARGTHRIYVARIGPLGIALWLVAFAALAALIFLVILGAVLIWIPVVALAVVAAAVFRFLRRGSI